MYRYEGPPNGRKTDGKLRQLFKRHKRKRRGKNHEAKATLLAIAICRVVFGHSDINGGVSHEWGPRW